MAEETRACPSCGREVRTSARFCTQCGAHLDDTAPREPGGATPGQREPEETPTATGPGPPTGGDTPPSAPTRRRRSAPTVISLVLATVAVAAVVVFLLTRSDGEEAEVAAGPTPAVEESEPTPEPTPELPTPPPDADFFSRITGITVEGDRYAVAFETFGFDPQLEGANKHVHFFFDTVPASQAGVPGGGPWNLYPETPGEVGTSPYTGYGIEDVPQGARQICILVANSDHSVIRETGNCWDLP